MVAKVFKSIGKFGLTLAVAGGLVNSALYNVDAVISDRFHGVQDIVVGEGTHFLISWNISITLHILFPPFTSQLPGIFTSMAEDHDERVLPSIPTEILKSVVARFDAGELIT
ncbi:Prohibitin [Plecturocebus cupreus]